MSHRIYEKSAWRWRGTIETLVGLGCTLAACGNHFVDEPEPRAIRIEPSDAMVSIVNGAAVAKTYTATLIDASGGERDVTGSVTFSLRDARYGRVQDATVTVTGQGAGPTRVIARYGELTGDTGLTIFVQDTIVDPDIDPSTPQWFDGAAEKPSLAPTIAYPPEHSLLPPNLGRFDVHWRQSTANVFEIKLSNTYIDIKRYTNGDDPNQRYRTVFESAQWYAIASAREPVAIDVAGMSTADPTTKGLSSTTTIDVTNEDMQGGIYYWTSSGMTDILRYDLSDKSIPREPYFTAERPPHCMGCHTVSRDGTKIAMTFMDGLNYVDSAVFDVASRTRLTQPGRLWYFATFNAQATKLVTVEGNQLYLRAVDGTKLADSPLPPASGGMATQPDFSPDNKRLVNVEFTSDSVVDVHDGSIVVRDYDDATNAFGAPTVLVAPSAGSTNAYPSFSPDGRWVAFTRTAKGSYNEPTAEIWAIKADGSQRLPVSLTKANLAAGLTNSWARWVPSQNTYSPSKEVVAYLTFSSTRAFGVIPAPPQIWMTQFYPDLAEKDQDPSGLATWFSFQDETTHNHLAQWTKVVVRQ